MNKIIGMFSFSGSAKRAKFLQFILIAIGLWLLAAYLDETFIAPNLCNINPDWICYLPGEVREGITLDRFVSVFLLLPFFSVVIRRLNSHQRNPLLSLLAIPLIGLLGVFLYMPELDIPHWQLIAAILVALPLIYFMLMNGKKE
ncbi:MAG: hypothetical protein WBC71_13675 [Salaquimonas sp.]